MAEVRSGQVRLRVLGTVDLNRKVRANVFASKLAALIRAMEAADKAANGTKTYEFLIADLKPSSAMALVQEQRANKNVPHHSGADIFGRCLTSVETGRYEFARQYLECTKQIVSIARDVEETFDGAELTVNGYDTVLVNKLFQAKATEAVVLPDVSEAKWFEGVTFGSLDGTIIVESIRGGETTMVLSLSVGGVEIECLCPDFTSSDIEPFFGKRVQVSGRITYKGDTGLPSKIEVLELPKLRKQDPDFMRWRGAFRAPDQLRDWDS